jgi:hypothetical protein
MMKLKHCVVGLWLQAALFSCSSDPAPPDDSRSDLELPEGGNILFEWVYYDSELQRLLNLPAGVVSSNRVIAYFMNHHTPELNPLPVRGTCNNLVTTRGWPAYVASMREDLDIGDLVITGQNLAGADVMIAVP